MDAPRRARIASSGVAALIALALAALHVDPAAGRPARRGTLEDVKHIVETRYFRDIDDRELEYHAIRGLFDALDPNSAFFTPEEARSFREETDGHFAGLGIEITVEKGLVTVITPLEDTPAFQAGILPGDRIIEIDGKPREFQSAEEAARMLKGPPGTKVTLTILHEGATRAEEITLTRREIDVKSVRYARLADEDRRVGTVKISQFKPGTARDLKAALEALLARGMQALVLDLRQNPGGHLDEAVAVADLFLEEGLIVRTVGKDATQLSERYAEREGTLPPIPLAVLINGGSASASEIVAGALKDLGRATIVGTRSFGKGSVQSLLTLADDSIVKITTAHYYTRSGRPIHREEDAKESDPWGIIPHVAVDLEPKKLMEIYRQRAALEFRAGNGKAATAPPPPNGELLRDPQLEAAIELLRKKLPATLARDENGLGRKRDDRPGEADLRDEVDEALEAPEAWAPDDR